MPNDYVDSAVNFLTGERQRQNDQRRDGYEQRILAERNHGRREADSARFRDKAHRRDALRDAISKGTSTQPSALRPYQWDALNQYAGADVRATQDLEKLKKRFGKELDDNGLPIEYNPRTHWQTEDGTVIAYADMEDGHLNLAINAMEERQQLYQHKAHSAQNKAARLKAVYQRRQQQKEFEAEQRRNAEKAEEQRRLYAAKRIAQQAYNEAMEAALKGNTKDRLDGEGRKFRD